MNELPDIISDNNIMNPCISSPNALYSITFGMNKEQSYNFDDYRWMIDSAIREFRKSQTYSHYKAYLIGLGLNRCMMHPNIQNQSEEDQMATLEMHHCPLTIFDICCILSEHYLNSGYILTEFDLSELLRIEHTENRVGLVMLCKGCHQLYHHSYLYVHPDQIFGKWWELLDRYPLGVTQDIAYRLLNYLNQATDERYEKKKLSNEKLLKLRDKLLNWSGSR